MSNASLPERPSLEFLKKLAKERLQELRRTDPAAKLSAAQLAVAREHGFASWRALKAEVDRRSGGTALEFFEAAERGDLDALRTMLSAEPALVRATDPRARFGGWTALHVAAQRGHRDIATHLLERGADPNAREEGDNTIPLHWAAAGGHLEIVRTLLDAGSDVHGFGDLHELDVIGWATYFRGDDIRRDVLALLIERGARHHIFSALSVGEPDVIRRLVEQRPDALARRMSRFEQKLTPLHFAISRQRLDLLELLIQLGADLEAVDARDQTALDFALLRGEHESMRRLLAAGATPSTRPAAAEGPRSIAAAARSVDRCVAMIGVPDIAAALDWYTSLGFTEVGRYAESGLVNFGHVSLGKAELMFGINENPSANAVQLWLYTDQVDRIYEVLRNRLLNSARAALSGDPISDARIVFEEDLYEPFYGGRQFSIRDPFGYNLIFYQER